MDRLEIQLPARFLSVGQLVAREGWSHPRRTLDSSVLIVTQSGRFVVRMGERRYVLGPNQMLVLPAGCEHWGEPSDGDVPPVYYWVHFLDGRGEARHRIEVDGGAEALPEDVFNREVSLFHQLISEQSMGAQLACDYLLSLLLLELAQRRREDPKAALFNRVNEYIRLHYREKLTLSQLSSVFGYSEDYLSRLLHANMRCSFREYIHRLRLAWAKKELLSTVKNIQEISEQCGYSNAKFFSTAFLRHEGVTPSAYRNLYGGLHQNNE